jgi:hypothetical protein
VAYEVRSADGQVSYPLGRDAAGYIIYSADGYMSVAFMPSNRARFASKTLDEGNTEEKALAAETYQSYSGKYEIQGELVVHHVEVSLFPNLRGTDLKRTFVFEGNRLTLSPRPSLVNGVQQTSCYIWERV